MYICVFEWDGETPPTTYYNRLHAFGMRVRGNKELDPNVRRAGDKAHIVIQESVIMASSRSVVDELAKYVRETWHPKGVYIGEITLNSDTTITPADRAVIDRINNVLGKVGRPSKNKQDWTVVCLEEIQTFVVPDARDVVNCPHCGGFSIKIKPGAPQPIRPPRANLPDFWLRTRFCSGDFQPPLFSDVAQSPPAKVNITNKNEQPAAALIAGSAELVASLARTPKDDALALLDAVFVARAYSDPIARKKARITAAAHAFQMGAEPKSVALNESETSADILDAAYLLGAEKAARMFVLASQGAIIKNGHKGKEG